MQSLAAKPLYSDLTCCELANKRLQIRAQPATVAELVINIVICPTAAQTRAKSDG